MRESKVKEGWSKRVGGGFGEAGRKVARTLEYEPKDLEGARVPTACHRIEYLSYILMSLPCGASGVAH